MKAAVVYETGAEAEIVDLELQSLGEDDVLVKIEASGLCHSDVSVLNGAFPAPLPVVIGHEGAGVVEAVGSRVTDLAEGDHVVLTATISCGVCDYCTKGLPCICRTGFAAVLNAVPADGRHRLSDSSGRGVGQFACLGTLAEEVIVPKECVIKIRDDVPFDVASIVGCAVVTGFGAVLNKTRPKAGTSSVVIGCGGIGLSIVQGAKVVGQSQIIAVDPVKEKRDLALRLGATEAIDPAAGDLVEAVMEATGGVGADYAFEAVGKPELVRQAWQMTALDGTVVGIGVAPSGTDVTLPAQDLCTSEKSLVGCVQGSIRPRQDMPLYLDMYKEGILDLDSLIDRHYKLADLNGAVSDLEAGTLNGRGVLLMD